MTDHVPIKSVLIIIASLLVAILANPTKEKCLEDIKRTTNYIELSKFIGHSNAIIDEFVSSSETLDFDGYQKNCFAIRNNGTYLRNKLVGESDCLKVYQGDLMRLVEFDRIMSIFDFWCTLNDEERKGD